MNKTSPSHLDDQLGFAIYLANLAINRAYFPALEELEITYTQYLVLSTLAERDQHTLGSIGDRLSLESSTLTPLVKRLETAGFVARQRNPLDERQIFVSLLPKGRDIQQKSKDLDDALLERLNMDRNGASELAATIRNLGKRVSQRGGLIPLRGSDHV